MTVRILLMLAAAVPVLLGFASHACRGARPMRFGPAIGPILSRSHAAACFLVGAWMLFGIRAFLSVPTSPRVMVVGLGGLMFGSLFGLTASLLEWLEDRPGRKVKPSSRLASKGPLWDADLDR